MPFWDRSRPVRSLQSKMLTYVSMRFQKDGMTLVAALAVTHLAATKFAWTVVMFNGSA